MSLERPRREEIPKTVLRYDFNFSSYDKLNIFLLVPGISLTILSLYKVNLWFIFFRFLLGRLIISSNGKLNVAKNRMVLDF